MTNTEAQEYPDIIIRSILTGDEIKVHATTDSPDSSYGFKCWVDDSGESYGQCQ